MPLIVTGAKKAEMAQRAAILGGYEGWPTPEWNKGKNRFLAYSPYLDVTGSKEFPISGTVNGRLYATCKVSSSFSTQVGSARRTTTYQHTAAIIANAGMGLPFFDVLSNTGGWAKPQNLDMRLMNCGDGQFHQFFSISANAPDQQRVHQFLTPNVKARLYDVLRANSSARLRFGTRDARMFCWVNGKDARDEKFPPLLVALANLADVVDAELAALRPQPMQQPQFMQQQQQQFMQPQPMQPYPMQPPYNPQQPGWNTGPAR